MIQTLAAWASDPEVGRVLVSPCGHSRLPLSTLAEADHFTGCGCGHIDPETGEACPAKFPDPRTIIATDDPGEVVAMVGILACCPEHGCFTAKQVARDEECDCSREPTATLYLYRPERGPVQEGMLAPPCLECGHRTVYDEGQIGGYEEPEIAPCWYCIECGGETELEDNPLTAVVAVGDWSVDPGGPLVSLLELAAASEACDRAGVEFVPPGEALRLEAPR